MIAYHLTRVAKLAARVVLWCAAVALLPIAVLLAIVTDALDAAFRWMRRTLDRDADDLSPVAALAEWARSDTDRPTPPPASTGALSIATTTDRTGRLSETP